MNPDILYPHGLVRDWIETVPVGTTFTSPGGYGYRVGPGGTLELHSFTRNEWRRTTSTVFNMNADQMRNITYPTPEVPIPNQRTRPTKGQRVTVTITGTVTGYAPPNYPDLFEVRADGGKFYTVTAGDPGVDFTVEAPPLPTAPGTILSEIGGSKRRFVNIGSTASDHNKWYNLNSNLHESAIVQRLWADGKLDTEYDGTL